MHTRFPAPGKLHRFIEAATFQEHTELVTAKPRECIAPANFRFQQRTELAEQSVTRVVAARIVDDLELIEIEVQQCIRGFPRPGAL